MPKLALNVPLPILGLDASKPAEFLDSRAWAAMKNITMDRGEMRKRDGTTSVGSTLGERVLRLFEFEVSGVTYLVRVGPTKVEVLNKGAGTWASIANAALTGTATDNVDYAFPNISAAKVVCYTNGIDAIRKYNGSGNDADLGGSPPKCSYMTAFGDYLLLGKIASFPQRVQWPDTADPETWSGGNSGSTNLIDDADDITAIDTFGRFVTVHKANTIYLGQLVTTSEVFRFDRKATGVGTVNFKTIQNLPTGEQIFLAKDGLRLFNGITAPWIEAKINDEIRASLNAEYVGKAWSVLRKDLDEYHIGLPIGSQTEPDTVYKYNYRMRQVYKDVRPDISAASAYLNTNEVAIDDLTGTIDSQTWRYNDVGLQSLNLLAMYGGNGGVTTREDATVNNDNGTAIDASFETKDFTALDFQSPNFGTLMRVIYAQLWAKGSTLTIHYSIDSGTSWTKISKETLGSTYPADSAPISLYFDSVASKIRFKFSNDVAGETFTLKKYLFEAGMREQRR